jgi:hypothetical protein
MPGSTTSVTRRCTGPGVLPEQLQRRFGLRRDQHPITGVLEDASRHVPHTVIVLDQEDRLGSRQAYATRRR